MVALFYAFALELQANIVESAYIADILKLSVQEWIDLLNDSSIFTPESLEMIQYIYRRPNHQATATDIGLHFGFHANKASSITVFLAKRILDKLGKEPQKRENGENIFWNIPFQGVKPGEAQNKKLWMWRIRPNLVEAISTLYSDLEPIYDEPEEEYSPENDDEPKNSKG
ncbi:hypothetical protein FACS1894187_12160 [Synergistales bacterium]|nr:hypothetical protein FACS1894187_12160 [Synergistales bacterium]